MTYFPLHQTTCFFIPLVAPCKPLLLIGDMYLKGCTNIADLFKNRSSAIEQDKSKAREYYKKAAEHNQAEGAHKMVETTAGTVERAYWTNVAEKQGYKNGMKSWTSDIEEFNQ